ncbi:MAG TPA: threonylcarbamoyl-AMP synthase [Blastocatellia bacterium]|nr:threonylcarbamoyl-AMP synthase [Blastocatellia bacterium]
MIQLGNESLDRAAEAISRGGIIAFRTDTLYGLGANPFNREAVRRIKQLKGREENKPILIVISDYDQLYRFIDDVSPAFELLAKHFWPGALTLIGRACASIPEEITAGTKSVGVRLPDDDRVRAIVRSCGGALTATSANPSDAAPAGSAREVHEYFDDAIDLIIDDGEVESELPSTVVDVSGPEPGLIREGVIAWAKLQDEFRRFIATDSSPLGG